MMKKNNSQKGISLPELLVSVAIGGMVSIVISKLSFEQVKTNKKIESSMDISVANDEIRRILSDPESCRATFKCASVGPGESTQITQIRRVPHQKTEIDAQTRFSLNQQIGNVKISKMTLSRSSDAPNDQMSFEVEFERINTKISLGSKIIKRNFSFQASFAKDNNNVISSCNPFQGNMDSCELVKSHCLNQRDLYSIILSNGHSGLAGEPYQRLNYSIDDMCGNTHSNSKDWTEVSSMSFSGWKTFEETSDLNSFTVIIVGGGGGGGASIVDDNATNDPEEYNYYCGNAGEHGEVVVVRFPGYVDINNCKAYVGKHGTGGTATGNPKGTDGEDTYLHCINRTYVAKGGKGGGVFNCRPNNSSPLTIHFPGSSVDGRFKGKSSLKLVPYWPGWSLANFSTFEKLPYSGAVGNKRAGAGYVHGGNKYFQGGVVRPYGKKNWFHGGGGGGSGIHVINNEDGSTSYEGVKGGDGANGSVRLLKSQYQLTPNPNDEDDGCQGLSSSNTVADLECTM